MKPIADRPHGGGRQLVFAHGNDLVLKRGGPKLQF